MRFLIFISILLSVSVLSCGKHRKGIKVKHKKKPVGVSIGNVDNRQTTLDITQIQPDKVFFILNHDKTRRKVEPICRGSNGCLDVCEHFKEANKCKHLSVNQVLHFWMQKLAKYNWESAKKDLQFIATNKEVATFLQTLDKNHRVLKSLFQLGTYAKCPIRLNLGIQYAPFTTLYLKPQDTSSAKVAPSPTGATDTDSTDTGAITALSTKPVTLLATANSVTPDDATAPYESEGSQDHSVEGSVNKDTHAQDSSYHPHITWSTKEKKRKIIDSAHAAFDFPIFFSFIKKCFGQNPARTFTDVAVEIENKAAFDIAHSILSQACDKNSECIRLAYCDINSPTVWKQVPEEYKRIGCDYKHFIEPIPEGSVDKITSPPTDADPAT